MDREASGRRYKKIERSVFLVIVALTGFALLIAAMWFVVAVFFPPEELIQEVEFGNRTYQYTCRTMYDGMCQVF